MSLKRELIAAGVANSTADAIGGSLVSGITAHAGGGQASATALTGAVNVLGTVATAGDSVLLPQVPTDARDEIWVLNQGAASANVFPPSGGAINALSANAAYAVAAGAAAVFKSLGDGLSWAAK